MHRFRLLFRGLTRRCPRCGEWRLFHRWTSMVDTCPRCGYNYELEEGYWVGAMTVNIAATELLFVVLLALAVIYYWPDLPVIPLIVVGVAVNGLFPLIFYPLSKTVWVAVDLSFFNQIDADDVR